MELNGFKALFKGLGSQKNEIFSGLLLEPVFCATLKKILVLQRLVFVVLWGGWNTLLLCCRKIQISSQKCLTGGK
ncbi:MULTISPECIES: hypothetical protein, partial [unclassified Limnobacter]|uniref:hypothetical protein n=1 Tax=unclassified Limnobacter TaxID=2630203 RepID=UPI0025C1A5B0